MARAFHPGPFTPPIRTGRYGCATIWRRPRNNDLQNLSVARPVAVALSELLPLPFDAEPVTLGEGMTPLLPCPRLGQALGLSRLTIKDESQLPTGSFKSRGMTTAVSLAQQLGLNRLAIPTAGNAGGALAAYAARAGMEVFVFMPDDTPVINQMEAYLAGAHVFLVNGLITDCGRLVREGTAAHGLVRYVHLERAVSSGRQEDDGPGNRGTNRLAAAERDPVSDRRRHWLDRHVESVQELRELGWLRLERLPRLISCQSDGCAPIVRAFEKGERFAEPFANAHTIASGLRVPAAVGDFMMLDAIRASGGVAPSPAARIDSSLDARSVSAGGYLALPRVGSLFSTAWSSSAKAAASRPPDDIVVFNTGAAQKYPETVTLHLPELDKNQPIDYAALAP